MWTPGWRNQGHRRPGAEQDAGMAKGWDHAKCAKIMTETHEYIGYMATIEYGGMTNHGKLRFPKFKALRRHD